MKLKRVAAIWAVALLQNAFVTIIDCKSICRTENCRGEYFRTFCLCISFFIIDYNRYAQRVAGKVFVRTNQRRNVHPLVESV